MMLFCFKYLRKKYFVFFVIFEVPACMPVPHNFEHNHGQGGLGMDGVVRGGASFIDIYSIPYTLLLLLFLTYLHPIHFPFLMCFTSLFFSFCCCVSCLHTCAKHLFASIPHTLLFAIWDSRAFTLLLHLSSPILTFITALLKI